VLAFFEVFEDLGGVGWFEGGERVFEGLRLTERFGGGGWKLGVGQLLYGETFLDHVDGAF
jgi:hypothetical protein